MLTVMLILLPGLLRAEDRLVRLYAPAALVDTGLMKHMLPRFSLKTQVRVEVLDDPADANLTLGDAGRALFEGAGQVWKMDVSTPDHPGTAKLAAWLTSEVGQRTITGFAPDGEALFGPPGEEQQEVVEVALDGDAVLGHEVSRAKCTRCHAVDDATRGWGIGSTPSFGILRALPDWEARFAAFYVLNPHPAFTQITDLTEPFPENRPSPIAPVVMDLEELEALMAYVATMPAADLGKPLDHQ
ncbi:MAG: hypothetical protein AB3N23_21885 [Paracoccaceae bacterium]